MWCSLGQSSPYAILPATNHTEVVVRYDGRQPGQLREVCITTGVQEFAEGSVVIETGRTRVMCAVSVESGVPSFLSCLLYTSDAADE